MEALHVHGQNALTVVLSSLGLRLTHALEGERRLVLKGEKTTREGGKRQQEKGEGGGERKEQRQQQDHHHLQQQHRHHHHHHQQQQQQQLQQQQQQQQQQRQQWQQQGQAQSEQQQLSMLFELFEGEPSLTPSLSRWLIRQIRSNQAHTTAYGYIRCLRLAFLALQPALPSSPSSTPASLQAVFLQPDVQRALLLNSAQEARHLGQEDAARQATALKLFLAVLKLTLAHTEGGVQLVVVGEGGEGWEGWEEGET